MSKIYRAMDYCVILLYCEFAINACTMTSYNQTDYHHKMTINSDLSYLFHNRGKSPEREATFIASSYHSAA